MMDPTQTVRLITFLMTDSPRPGDQVSACSSAAAVQQCRRRQSPTQAKSIASLSVRRVSNTLPTRLSAVAHRTELFRCCETKGSSAEVPNASTPDSEWARESAAMAKRTALSLGARASYADMGHMRRLPVYRQRVVGQDLFGFDVPQGGLLGPLLHIAHHVGLYI